MGNHRSKTAKIGGFHLARNTLLGLNELTYSLLVQLLMNIHWLIAS